jgi:hypothetical protein
VLAVAALCLSGIGSNARAEPSQRDLEVLARSLGFLDQPPSGSVELGLVYVDQFGARRELAERLANGVEQPIRVGNISMRLRALSLTELPNVTTHVLFLVEDSLESAMSLSAVVRGRRILTAASNPAFVSSGLIVMAVKAAPRVKIIVSRKAEQEAGISFAPAFRMMIQEQ